MQIIPPSVSKLWSLLEIRVLVLFSLGLQSILTFTGNMRKNSASKKLSTLLWLTYLSAEWAVTVSLSVLSNNAGNSVNHSVNPDLVITAFWAPFLHLHLGGPDTITAYSLEDNELWRRHALTLVTQVTTTVYVVLSRIIIKNVSSEDTFKIIEIELGFIYDVFHSKAVVLYSFVMDGFSGCFTLYCISLRCFNFLSISSVSMAFLITEKHDYSRVEGDRDTIKGAIEVEFDESILLWHIATNLCFYSNDQEQDLDDCKDYRDTSQLLSNYMLYLLVFCPLMLPNGIGHIRFHDTRAEAIEFFYNFNEDNAGRTLGCKEEIACKKLLNVKNIPPTREKQEKEKLLLPNAHKLAHSLLFIENKWEFICYVWVEMLGYAASHCQWNQHAQRLTQGGELLTHVWLLMAHLGITEQFKYQAGKG
ncbi:hypothetical protein RGQ29_021513 [Quercus rubra]|uniref:DUF4220 domain-containing protein n=1 Tax=Quercus rubra TaxID=3512 RepID=A0AAN7IRG3_QUERU|nr:hypothetical protein RGQ29_021513 [Quercus rubra]